MSKLYIKNTGLTPITIAIGGIATAQPEVFKTLEWNTDLETELLDSQILCIAGLDEEAARVFFNGIEKSTQDGINEESVSNEETKNMPTANTSTELGDRQISFDPALGNITLQQDAAINIETPASDATTQDIQAAS